MKMIRVGIGFDPDCDSDPDPDPDSRWKQSLFSKQGASLPAAFTSFSSAASETFEAEAHQ